MARHVLLIEDEPHIAEAIRFLLVRDGLEVSIHREGQGALARLRALRPDLVILDVMLPGASGFEILTELRKDPETAGLPVIMLSARGQDRDAAIEAGADLYMMKPFSNREIREAVRRLAGS